MTVPRLPPSPGVGVAASAFGAEGSADFTGEPGPS